MLLLPMTLVVLLTVILMVVMLWLHTLVREPQVMLVTLQDSVVLSNVLLAVIMQRLHILVHKSHVMHVHLQDSVVVLYNWLKRDTLSPHTWVTDYMNDLALPVNFVGLSTEDRRFIYPQKEVFIHKPCTCISSIAHCAQDYLESEAIRDSVAHV